MNNIMNKILPKIRYECRKNYGIIKGKLMNIQIVDAEGTLDKIIKDGCSISRFGDGELDLIFRKSLKFQDYNDELSKKLIDVIKSSGKNHLVCIPYTLKDINIFNEYGKKWWSENLNNNRYKWLSLLSRGVIYYDAFISRFYMEVKDKNRSEAIITKWKKVWDERDIVIIEGRYSRLGVGNDLFKNSKSIQRILCPKENAFEKYEEILNACKFIKKDKLILIALGPTATILAYDLCLLGYQALDIGHLDIEYEWYNIRASEKKAILNKYVNEVDGNKVNLELLTNESYYKEIIEEIN